MLSYIKQKISFKYFILTAVTIGLVFTVLYFWISHRQKEFIMGQVKKQAVILHKQIVLTRQWVSDHNYILIPAKPGTGKRNNGPPENRGVREMVYTRITPAGLTRRLSEYATRDNMFSFNLTNIDGLNPDNRPDRFEIEAIQRFRAGTVKSLERVETQQGEPVFRYAAPLVIQKSCLKCHQNLKDQVGGVGGCISVFIPLKEAREAIQGENIFLFFAMIGLTGSVILILFFSTQKLIFRPIKEIRKYTRRMSEKAFDDEQEISGDELKEFAGLCYRMDEKLKNYHQDLEHQIEEATRDLHQTNLELAKANQELSNLNRSRIDFFSDISHELRTPLTSIKGAVDYLTRTGACKDPAYIKIIRKNTDHLIRTILDFLEYSKIETGRLELDFHDESLNLLIQEAIDTLQPDILGRGLTIKTLADRDFILNMDRHKIFQVISNLFSNAVKFSPENGTITIHMDTKDRYVRFSVEDQGPGIPREHHRAVFKKFYQLPSVENHIHKGSSGIGLAICKGVVEAHGGRIWVENRPGGGCRFVFLLPGMEQNHE